MINVEAFQEEGSSDAQMIEKVVVDKHDNTMSTSAMHNDFISTSQNTIMEKENKAVVAKITTYGTDCFGCYNTNGFRGTATGVKLSFDSVRQSDGTWKEGITYDGYYVVAANSSIPFGSIIEVSNHGYSGLGLVEGQPFYAMVLDRGAMTLNHLDLFVGSEDGTGVSINRGYQPTMKVIRYGY